MFLLYNAVLLVPRLGGAVLGAWARRSASPTAREWLDRLGQYRQDGGREADVWVQAASVGEVRVAWRLVRALETARPATRILLTTTTRTGRKLAASLGQGTAVDLAFFPLDFPPAVRRALGATRPRVLALVETEIWPNLLRECGRAHVRTIIVNGRVSPRCFRRYRMVRPLIRRALEHVDLACVQTDEDRSRFLALGLSPDRVRVSGNMKYDLPPEPPPDQVERFRLSLGLGPTRWRPGEDARSDPLMVAGSTAQGEDRLVLEAFRLARNERPRARLILAPRHPERFAAAAEEARRHGFSVGFRTSSLHGEAAPPPDVLVLDTMGELPLAYAAAQAAFVGGSLVAAGGQNMLEPASAGLPPIFGPHTENFREPAERLLDAQAALRVSDPRELAEAFTRCLSDAAWTHSAGERARNAVMRAAGATERCARAIQELL
jgi:3-deoxy-D-manno-octulosonic-acid transferase